jgi:hypothetical protein
MTNYVWKKLIAYTIPIAPYHTLSSRGLCEGSFHSMSMSQPTISRSISIPIRLSAVSTLGAIFIAQTLILVLCHIHHKAGL